MSRVEKGASFAPLRWILDALFRDVGLKVGALALSMLVFVVTRDEVTRVFTIPLRVVEDPSRVLVHPAPDEIKAELRGPWARVNRLQEQDLGVATLDLRGRRPGPMEIDPATLVMPTGVVLDRLVYDPVDLRFEPVVERSVPIVPTVIGVPDADHERGAVVVDPPQWTVRGGQTAVSRVKLVATDPIELQSANTDVRQRAPLLTPGPGVRLVPGEDGGRPEVDVRVEVRDVIETRRFTAAVVPAAEGLDLGSVPASYEVSARGPRASLRRALGDAPGGAARAVARPVEPSSAGGARQVELTITWSDRVAPELQADIALDPTTIRIPYQPLTGPQDP